MSLSTEFSYPVEDVASREMIDRRLAGWRDALIDLTRRNPLLALPAPGRTHLVLPGMLPGQLLDTLSGRRALTLAQEAGDSDDLGQDPEPARRRAALTVPQDAFHTLERLRRHARLTMQEQGVNTLFAALGVLEWTDPQMRGEALRAPLLLVPVTLERVPGDDALRLRRFEDEAVLNPALRFRLERGDVALPLPMLFDDEPLDPDAFLQSVRSAVAGRDGWSVVPDCLVGRFSFQKFAMYRDLESLAPEAARHPLVAALAGDTGALRRLPAVTLPRLEDLDSAPETLYPVLEADPSQRLAILAARRGQSFVLQGPPGTGKSQTIANIIADGIAGGKRVLFVSQKTAALDAVSKRLRDRGLATFCLEAHSHKASKRHVLDQLGAALEARAPEGRLPDAERKDAERLRAQLNQTVAALHAPRLPLGLSVYEANGLAAGLTDVPDLPFVLSPESVTQAEYQQFEDVAAQLAEMQPLLLEMATHPWRGVLTARSDAPMQSRLRSSLEASLVALDGLKREAATLADACRLEAPRSVGESDRLLAVVDLLLETPCPPPSWLTASPEEWKALRDEAQMRRDRQSARRAAYAALWEDYEESLFSLPLTDLEHRLDDRHDATLQPAFGNEWRVKVARHAADLDEILKSIWGRSARVQRAASLLSETLGLPNAGTIAEAADLLRVGGQIASLKALPGWLEPGALPRLVRRCAEARTQHDAYNAERARLMERYAEGMFLLDLPAMHARFSQEYNGPFRFLNPQYHVEMRVLRSVSKEDLPGPGEIVQDLAAARTVLVRQYWISLHEQELEEAFGSYYEGTQTDWAALSAMLQETKAFLAGFPEESLPPALSAVLRGSRMARRPLADRLEQGKTAFAAFGESLRALGAYLDMTGLPFTSQPLPQALLSDLAAWAETLREAVADFEDACRLGISMRRAARPLPSVVHLAGDVSWAAALQRGDEIEGRSAPAQRVQFGAFYQGLETDWDRVIAAWEWTERLRSLFPDAAVPEDLAPLVQDADAPVLADLADHRTRVRMRREFLREAYSPVRDLFPPERLQSNGHALETLRYEAFGDWLRARRERLPELEQWITLQALRGECERLGLLSFFETAAHHRIAPKSIVPAFRKRFHRIWLDAVLDADPALRAFRGKEQETRIARFALLDARRVEYASEDVRALAQARRPTALFTVGEAAVLRAQLHRKRPLPIRSLLGQMPNLLACLKPCLMMSPLSVSLFLDPERIGFDLVIFDEASQVFVQDAIAALLRGPQVILSGDSRQLPPTSFFLASDDDAEDADDDPAAGGFESILDAADVLAGDGSPHFARLALTWHYRSRDESLIAFARRQFYPRMTTFPAARAEWSVAFEYVPDGVYYGGRNACRDNPVEAARVADLVISCARSSPGQSLGVIALGEGQRMAVERAIAERLRAEPDLEPLLNEDGPEGFFVKTIESVQGDERDVIFLSVGYGPGPDGSVAQRFGPLGQEGGERRFNVAVTRARRECVVVGSLLPSEIASERTGPRLLREYLEYARGGAQGAAHAPGAAPTPSAFEQIVEAALTARGHRVRRQVGSSGQRIPLAIVDPDDPARCLLGIECDGPSYRDVPTASARDRLRGQVLRGFGWSLLRVWSSEWVRNPDAEIARIEAALLPDGGGTLGLPFPEAPRLVLVDEAAPPPLALLPPGVTVYERSVATLPGGGAALFAADAAAREEFLCSVIGLEGPLSPDAAAQRLASAAGLARAGRRVRAILEDTVETMIEKGILEQREEFLWTRGARPPARAPRPGEMPRPLDQVALEEVGEIALAVLRAAFGMRREELVVETARLLGYRAPGAKARDRVDAAVSLLELDNRIHVQGGQVRSLEIG